MARRYYLAPSLVQLRNEINKINPNRDKTSDGWIGDAAHAARKSDHNPDYDNGGVVRALDIDKDGVNLDAIVAQIIKDPRVNYVIWNGHIWSRKRGFRKHVYTGANKHRSHMHVSIMHNEVAEGNVANWLVSPARPTKPTPPTKPAAEIVDEIFRGEWGDGADRKRRLEAAGYNYSQVQEAVNRRVQKNLEEAKKPRRKTNEEVAKEVLAGKWGDGKRRRQLLRNAGYDPAAVQQIVNRTAGRPQPVKKTVSQLAQEVINGKWGVGKERQRRLRASGYNYRAVQDEVNRRLR